ncbi:putative copper radical oxidase [Pisolithus croceorrhizus]|nr:putative copper radical oxidase [Pisolithus croceorrhizus]
MLPSLPWLAFGVASSSRLVYAQSAGSIAQVGDSLVSAMMMFLGNEEKVYILDKAEGNSAQINGHPAWGSAWDINSHTATLMEVYTNTFCASGMHLPNGSYATFGGNGAVGPGGSIGSVLNNAGSGAYDATYGDYDGGTSIRILNPCTNADDWSSSQCQWFDNATVLSMQKRRWYSACEPLGDGTIALIGGFVNGGYINRNTPNTDPAYEGGAAEPTYEFFPSRGAATEMQFMVSTSGLNSYAHTYLMPSGKMLVQANISTMLWDPDTNTETQLPGMPGNVVRVYPASGAVAMLPLTPANNWTPTILFCGGSDMPDSYWGNYSYPYYNTWDYPASKDCQRLTPEPPDGSSPAYQQDDDMLEDGTMLVVNGGLNGTAGYAQATGMTPNFSTPAIYNPNMPSGSRWSNAGLGTSNLARLYHSSAMLLPDASVMIAGSNPNIDPTGIPSQLSYGGAYFNITVPATSYSGSANAAASNTTVVLSRGGFTTHAMNMGQRHLQLNNTYTVNSDGSYVLHVAQAPPNPNLLQPGPALLFVVVNGIPSNGTMVIVGSGNVETQPTSAVSDLPPNVLNDAAQGTGSSSNSSQSSSSKPSTGLIVGAIVGAIAVIGIIGAAFGIFMARRRRAASRQHPAAAYAMGTTKNRARHSDSSAFVPLQQDNPSLAWNASSVSLQYQDDYGGRPSDVAYDPYHPDPDGIRRVEGYRS